MGARQEITDPQTVWRLIQRGRDMYVTRDGEWRLTDWQGLETAWVNRHTAFEVRKMPNIRPRYSDLPEEVFTARETVDVAASMKLRKEQGAKAPLVYLKEPSTAKKK